MLENRKQKEYRLNRIWLSLWYLIGPEDYWENSVCRTNSDFGFDISFELKSCERKNAGQMNVKYLIWELKVKQIFILVSIFHLEAEGCTNFDFSFNISFVTCKLHKNDNGGLNCRSIILNQLFECLIRELQIKDSESSFFFLFF